MNRLHYFPIALIAAALILCATPSQARPQRRLGAKAHRNAAASGWITLFNGKDLTGWQNARNPKGPNKWTVKHGAMTNVPHGTDIGTVKQFKNFDLSLQFKTVKGGNSGVYLRGRAEVQVLDSYGVAKPTAEDNGAIYGQVAPLVNASKPAGEWNTLKVHLVGDRVTVKLNGKVVQNNTKLTGPTGGALPGGVLDPGPLRLQGDHGKVWYRDIKIRPLRTH